MDSEEASFRIVMFPWLAHGHIFPYLELAQRILKKKNFHIYLCSTAINFPSIKNFIQNNSLQNSIETVELHLQSSDLPPHYHTTKNLPSELNFTLLKAFQTAKSSFSDIIKTLKPDLVIYDIFQPWAVQIASSQGIPSVYFAGFGAATISYIHHVYSFRDDDFPFPELSLLDHEKRTIDALIQFLYTNVFEEDKDVLFANYKLSSEIVLLKTSRGFEGKYIDYVSTKYGKRLLPVGPLVTVVSETAEENNSDVMKWLSKKARHSTVYISFGSECFLSEEEIHEIAKALEICEGVNFIWVVRFPVGEKTITIEETMPIGFLDRVKDRGMVVSGWAPQANILAHPSTGAFVSHCGWSSLTESIYFGVPVIGMPMKLNMFVDARMLVDAGACLDVRTEENGVFKGENIANVISKVIMEKSVGDGLRLRAQELSEKMRTEEEELIEETAEQLWGLCLKTKGKKY